MLKWKGKGRKPPAFNAPEARAGTEFFMKHKKLLITFTVIFSVIVVLATFILIWFWGDEYPDFNDFKQSAVIPGLDEKAVPQGVANYRTAVYGEDGEPTTEEQDYLFISAYMKSGPSRIYVTGLKTGYVGYVSLKIPAEGEGADADYFGHAGGIATNCKRNDKNGTVWMTSDSKVYCMKGASSGYYNAAEEIVARAAKNSDGTESVKFTASFEANCNASFCFFYDDGTTSTMNDKLYVGEFYLKDNSEYSTDPDHCVTSPKTGATTHAFMYEYTSNIDVNNKYGLALLSSSSGVKEADRVPKVDAVYAIPDKVQGAARILKSGASASSAEGDLVLSSSWALSNSDIRYYDFSAVRATSSRKYSNYVKFTDSKGETHGKEFFYKGVKKSTGADYSEDPILYFADDSALARSYSVPSMAEGMCVVNRSVYVLFESGCYKYSPFVRQQLRNLYYFIPRK